MSITQLTKFCMFNFLQSSCELKLLNVQSVGQASATGEAARPAAAVGGRDRGKRSEKYEKESPAYIIEKLKAGPKITWNVRGAFPTRRLCGTRE